MMLIAAKADRNAAKRQAPAPRAAWRSPFRTDSVHAKGRARARGMFFVKAAVLILMAAALAVSSVMAYRVVSANPYFVVKNVNITGVRMLDPEQLRTLAGPPLTGNIFTRDLERAAALMKQNPWVESVSVRTKLPDIVEVAVTERKPVAAVALDGKLWLVDEKGYLIEETGRVRPPLVITGLRTPAVAGAPVADPRLFDAYRAASLFKLDTAFGDAPVAVDVGSPEKTAVRTAAGLVLKFGPDQEKWEEKFMEYLAVRGLARDFAPGFAGFDLSFNGQLVVTMKDGGKNENVPDHKGAR